MHSFSLSDKGGHVKRLCKLQSARLITIVSVIVLFCSTWMSAQSARARIVGTVKDPNGAVVQKAKITVTNVATRVSNTVTPPDNPDDSGAGTFNIAGARADSVTFLLDSGVDNNLISNGVVFTPNPDAVQEFRILTSNYTAEYGRNAGGIISIVTKSGTNHIHGSAFEFNRDSAFSANTYF